MKPPVDPPSILVYAYGNPGRQDDGLGILLVGALAEWAGKEGLENVGFESNYQLNIEDALLISGKDIVIFADASAGDLEGIRLSRVHPSGTRPEFTMHSASPSFILALCRELYGKEPGTWLLEIRGYEWALKEGLTPGAQENLMKALDFMKERLSDPGLLPD